MDTTIDHKVAVDEAFVPHAKRLRIGRSNFCLLSDIKSKESTLQLVYDVMRLSLFFKAFLVTVDVPEIYMHEFWATATVHHILSGVTLPKPKASVHKTRSSSDTTITPPTTAAGPRLTTSEKGKQADKASKANSLSALSDVATTEVQQLKLVTKRSLQQTYISQASGSGADERTGYIPGVPDVPTDESEEEHSWNYTNEEGDDDDDDQQVERDDEKDDKEKGGDDEQASDEEEFIHSSFNDDEGNGEEDLILNVGREERHDEEEEEDELCRDVNINQGRGMESIFKMTTQMDFDRLRVEAQKEYDEFLKTIDENMQKIIKEQVKEQVNVQVSKILPKIEQTVNEQLEAEVLTRSSNSSKTSYAVAADLFEMELKKILIEKIEGNKSIHRFNEHRNLYKALVEAYESDKIILDTYRDTVIRMIPEPGDAERDVNVNETFHEQTDDELSEKELNQIEANDQAIQTNLLGLPEDIYPAVDSCETAQEIWLRVQQMM
nr:hypothetical protein [Tanacetum cinerariifolium]